MSYSPPPTPRVFPSPRPTPVPAPEPPPLPVPPPPPDPLPADVACGGASATIAPGASTGAAAVCTAGIRSAGGSSTFGGSLTGAGSGSTSTGTLTFSLPGSSTFLAGSGVLSPPPPPPPPGPSSAIQMMSDGSRSGRISVNCGRGMKRSARTTMMAIAMCDATEAPKAPPKRWCSNSNATSCGRSSRRCVGRAEPPGAVAAVLSDSDMRGQRRKRAAPVPILTDASRRRQGQSAPEPAAQHPLCLRRRQRPSGRTAGMAPPSGARIWAWPRTRSHSSGRSACRRC